EKTATPKKEANGRQEPLLSMGPATRHPQPPTGVLDPAPVLDAATAPPPEAAPEAAPDTAALVDVATAPPQVSTPSCFDTSGQIAGPALPTVVPSPHSIGPRTQGMWSSGVNVAPSSFEAPTMKPSADSTAHA